MVRAKIKHDCKVELNNVELRATPARLAVMRLLETTNQPIDVSMIIEYLTQQDLQTDPATAFRIINMFTQKGITKQISFHEGKFRYELASREEHHHIICENCGKIEDFSDCAIPELEKDIQKKKQFLVKSH